MGAPSAKRPTFGLQILEALAVLLLFIDTTGIFVNGAINATYVYYPTDQAAIRAIYKAWQDTTDLAGWNSSSNPEYCEYLDPRADPSVAPSWEGVLCTYYCNSTVDDNCTERDVYVVGLELSNASIVGTLPPDIANISTLYTLVLTGNPKLSGPLPQELQNTWLNILDVHDNAFNGTIPSLPYLWNLLQLDLSGNQFTGTYPFEQLSSMYYLQELGLGNNLLYGPIPADAFDDKTQLKILDMSDNGFTGSLPDLTPMQQLTHLDVSGNQFEGSLPDLTSFSALRYLNLGGNNFTGSANLVDILDLSANPDLVTVDLSHNQLSGPLPSWNVSSLGSVQELYLDSNNLTGTLDILSMFHLGLLQDTASAFPNSTQLRVMSLSNNSIHSVISNPSIIANISTVFILQGNPYCRNFDSNDDTKRCYCSQECFVTSPHKNDTKIITISVTTSIVAVVLVLLIVVGAMLIKNRRYKRYLQLQFQQRFEEFDVKPTIFSYSELRAATHDFREDMKLGQGAYGAVYKGVLPSGNVIAVKQLLVKSAQGQDDFLNEVVLITGMKHRNLVNLKGCCLRESQKLLVYEFVENSDVEQVLLGPRKQEMSGRFSSWASRLKICLGVARGLHYLHALARPRVIHRDIKAGNILLDANMEPKIADFGLALLFPDERSHIMTVHVAGTKGYLAPEYASLGQLSDKVDVYSFGVLCMEIVSGRHNIDVTAPLDEVYLTQWAWQLHNDDRIMDLVDPSLHLNEDEVRDVYRFLNVCLTCISLTPDRRPTMARIVAILQGDTESEVQVLGEGKMSGTGSQRSRIGLRSVKEEDGHNDDHKGNHDGHLNGGSNGSSSTAASSFSGAPGSPLRRGTQGSNSFAVELREIRAR